MKKEGLLETLKHTLPWIIGIVTGVAFFAAAAVVTVLIPNHFYKRMTPIYWYDYVILAMISALLGLYMGRALFMRGRKAKCDYAAGGGMVGGFFAVMYIRKLAVDKTFRKKGSKKNNFKTINEKLNTVSVPFNGDLFIEEPGKSKLVNLLKVAEPQKLSLLSPGSPVYLQNKNRGICIIDWPFSLPI